MRLHELTDYHHRDSWNPCIQATPETLKVDQLRSTDLPTRAEARIVVSPALPAKPGSMDGPLFPGAVATLGTPETDEIVDFVEMASPQEVRWQTAHIYEPGHGNVKKSLQLQFARDYEQAQVKIVSLSPGVVESFVNEEGALRTVSLRTKHGLIFMKIEDVVNGTMHAPKYAYCWKR